MISTALKIASGPVEAAKRVSTDTGLQGLSVISTADAKALFGCGAEVMDGVMVRLVTLARSTAYPLTHYKSGLPTIQANCKVHLYTLRRRAANLIDPASPLY